MTTNATNIIIDRAINFAKSLNYPVENLRDQRKIGPKIGVRPPPQGTQLQIADIPQYIFEDKLIPFLSRAGPIYKFRLMLIPPNGVLHRGYGYVTYESFQSADLAFYELNNIEIIPGIKIKIKRVCSNRRIFIGGIPTYKKKDDIWHELIKIGMRGIIDVIMYKSYLNRQLNRGFVFVEFPTHEEAFIAKMSFQNIQLFGNMINIDWSSPIQSDDNSSSKIKTLVVSSMARHAGVKEDHLFILSVLGPYNMVEKIELFNGKIFIEFKTRRDAQKGLSVLKQYFKGSSIDVIWLSFIDSMEYSSRSTVPCTVMPETPMPCGSLESMEKASTATLKHADTNYLNGQPMDIPHEILKMINCLLD